MSRRKPGGRNVDAPPAALVDEIQTLAEELHPRPTAVRVRLEGTGPALASCEVWTSDLDGLGKHECDLPAAVELTMLDLERALVAAGCVYGLTGDGRPKYRFDANDRTYTLDFTRPW